ncbi:MAG: Serine/threonine-protein kinase PknD [Flavipsychrobacter sp.]|nr:Serine/threonine-protein kinase PknD [Flavipsychrobacter sp.]
MKPILLIVLLLPVFAQAQIINMFAGNGAPGYSGDGGPATAANLTGPNMARPDQAGNIYIADLFNNCIRKVNAAGTITTVAGSGSTVHSGDGGPATAAGVYEPRSIAIDIAGNIYFPENYHFGYAPFLRKVDTAGIISTIAGTGVYGYSGDGGPATAATFEYIADVVIDRFKNIYLVDDGAAVVRRIDTAGIITTIAGTGVRTFSGDGGPATAAGINALAIAIDTSGNIYIADYDNYRIRKVNSSGIISTVAGNGTSGYGGDGVPATSTGLSAQSVAVDTHGNIYISDALNYRIRKVDASGIITTIAGNGSPGHTGDGGPATAAELFQPFGVAVDYAGDFYISDPNSNYVRKVSIPTLPAFSLSSDSVCQNSCITLINTSTGHIDSLKWQVYGDTTLYPGKDTITACFQSSGIDSVKLYVYNAGLVDSSTQIVTIKQLPHPKLIDTLECGLYVPDIYKSYNWYVFDFWLPGGLPSAMGNTTYYTASTSSNYAYVVVDSNGCIGRSDTAARCVEAVNTVANPGPTITIFPNPVSATLTITSTDKISSVSVSNLIGQTLYNYQYHNLQVQVDVAELPTGVYIVRINDTEIRKFVKQ